MGFPERLVGGGGIGRPVVLVGGRGGGGRRDRSVPWGRVGADDGGAVAGGRGIGVSSVVVGGVSAFGRFSTTGAVRAERTRRFGASSPVGSTGATASAASGSTAVGATVFVAAAAFLAGAFLTALVALAAGAGSSGETSRRSPSASALRRTRSAWASSIDDEWLLTPIPNETERSRASLLVRPSSRANS